MSNISQLLAKTWDRDRIVAVAQFLPMVLDAPLKAVGKTQLHESLNHIGTLADSYRTLTRFSGLIDTLTPEKLQALVSPRDPTIRRLGLLEFISHTLFFPCEHIAFLIKNGVVKGDAARVGGLTVFFWFWSLVFAEIRNVYQMLLAYPYLTPKATDAASVKRQAEWKRLVLNLIKTTCFLIFSVTCFPTKGKPQLLTKSTGVLVPIHKAIELLSPSHLTLSTSTRGVLGLAATLCDFI